MAQTDYASNIFINCPFDKKYDTEIAQLCINLSPPLVYAGRFSGGGGIVTRFQLKMFPRARRVE